MPPFNVSAQVAAQAAVRARQQYGTKVMDGARAVMVQTRPLNGSEHELLPESGSNVAATDLRLFDANPADYPVLPAPGHIMNWGGNDYTVIFAVGYDITGVGIGVKIYVYRTPTDDNIIETSAQSAMWPAPPE